jgi:nitrogen fixation protein FixH
MSMAQAGGYRVTGRQVLIFLVLFFVIIIGLDVWFATLAFRTRSGDVASNPYEAGIAFNQTLAQRRREAELGWRVEAELNPPGIIALTVRDRTGAALEGLAIDGRLTRPATNAGQRTLLFKAEGSGRYVADAGALPGAWDLTATARDSAGNRFEVTDRIDAR